MLISIIQALVHTCLNDEKKDFKHDFLQDALWKSARFGLDCDIIDPLDDKVISMNEMIKRMINYAYNSLKYFDNKSVINTIEEVINVGSEASMQIKEFNEFGFKHLKKYLINNVDYNL